MTSTGTVPVYDQNERYTGSVEATPTVPAGRTHRTFYDQHGKAVGQLSFTADPVFNESGDFIGSKVFSPKHQAYFFMNPEGNFDPRLNLLNAIKGISSPSLNLGFYPKIGPEIISQALTDASYNMIDLFNAGSVPTRSASGFMSSAGGLFSKNTSYNQPGYRAKPFKSNIATMRLVADRDDRQLFDRMHRGIENQFKAKVRKLQHTIYGKSISQQETITAINDFKTDLSDSYINFVDAKYRVGDISVSQAEQYMYEFRDAFNQTGINNSRITETINRLLRTYDNY